MYSSVIVFIVLLCNRINAYIEEEVQRRLRKLNLLNSSSSVDLSPSLSCESLRVRLQPPHQPYECPAQLLDGNQLLVAALVRPDSSYSGRCGVAVSKTVNVETHVLIDKPEKNLAHI